MEINDDDDDGFMPNSNAISLCRKVYLSPPAYSKYARTCCCRYVVQLIVLVIWLL